MVILDGTDSRSIITNFLSMLEMCCRRNCRGGSPDGYAYAGPGDFLRKHGVWYEPRPLPKRVLRGLPGNCYRNAQKLSRRRGYSYVEGYAVPDIGLPLPVHHAWNLDRNGDLIDNTWRDVGLAYFGVVFPLDIVNEAIRPQGGSVLDDWRGRFKIFEKPYHMRTLANG
jgi:hypothetical protein